MSVKKLTTPVQAVKFKEIRIALGLERKSIATSLGLTPEQVKSIELGKASVSGPVLKLLAIEFGVNRDFINGGSVEMFTANPVAISHCQPGTNKHQRDIAFWINEQVEPEIMWAELKRHLMKIEPDFTEYLKKRQGDNLEPRSGTEG